MANVLIIDDDEMLCEILSRRIMDLGHTAETALTLKNGVWMASSKRYDVVFLDVFLPDGNGLNQMPFIQATPSKPEIIIITGAGDPNAAELAVNSGAWDYIQKPFSKNQVTLQLVRALEYREQKSDPQASKVLKRDGLIGSSHQMNACLALLAQTVHSNANVLITGETGTGKELFARAIHDNSLRANRNFVVVDCTVLPEKLAESVLFGHEKGSFTGADKTHVGLIKQADGGTLFLDEVGELPLSIQKTFLRVLQERRFRPVGGKQETVSDFRLVAATNRNIENIVRSSEFRQDLLFRLRSFTIELPPLRDRIRDIGEIAMFHVAKICKRHGIETKSFSPDFFEMLTAYTWPGNIRELVNTLEMVVSVDPLNPILFAKHLPNYIRTNLLRSSVSKEACISENEEKAFQRPKRFPKLKNWREKSIAEIEKQYLNDLMALTKGNIKDACQTSGLGRARLYELMKKYNISRLTEVSFGDAV